MLDGLAVLVVEDDEAVRQFACGQLQSLGCRVTTVPTGWDALNLLSGDEQFDVLFTDLVLPDGLSGVELARRARRAFGADLKVILTSGHSAERLEHLGATDTALLRKPYRRAQLQQVLLDAFNGPSGERRRTASG